MNRLNAWLRLGAAAVSCALASCGGGGGGGGGGGISVTSNANGFQLVGIVPDTSTSNTVTFTLSGGSGQTLYAAAVSGMANLQANVLLTSDTQAMVTLIDGSGSDAAGRTTGTVTFELCSDQNCSHVVWSHDYPVMSTRFHIAADPLTLTGSEGSDTTASLAVTPPDTDHLLTASTIVVPSSPAWLTAAHDSTGNFTVTASAANLAAGNYTGTLMVGSTTVPAYYSTNVSFHVGEGMTAPALADIVERADTTASALQGSGPLDFVGRTGAWTATSDTAWLVVDTPTGSGSGLISYHVDLAAADAAVPNWNAGKANITFVSPGMTTVSSQVTYRRQLPEVALVTPSQVWPGQAATVRVTGRGLSQLTSIGQIHLGSQAATAGTLDSDSQVTLQLPALSAGSVQVSVANGLHTSGTQANLAIAAGRLAYAAVPTTGSKNDIVYDPSRQAVFAADSADGTLVRWKLSGGTWAATSKPLTDIWRVQLSADRQTLYAVTWNTLYELDPDTLDVRTTHDGAAFAGNTYDEPMPLTIDQRLWMPEGNGLYFDLRTRAFTAPVATEYGPNSPTFEPLAATPDGSHLFTVDANGNGFSSSGWYSAGTQTSMSLPVGLLVDEYRANFDVDGGRGLFEWQWVYDTTTWNLVGTASLGSNEQGVGGVLSPDGTRVYRLAGPPNANQFVSDHVEVFDVTQPAPGSHQLPMIGTIAVPDQAVNCSFNCDVIGRLAIDPLGSTLFWVGDQKMVVIPIPQGLAQPASARSGVRRLLPATVAASRR